MSGEASPLVLACSHLLAFARPVGLIVHHADGMWQMTCGCTDHAEDASGAGALHIHHLLDRAPDLADVMLRTPPGHLSTWADGEWVLEAHDD